MDTNIEYKDFIGIYDGFVDEGYCNLLQTWFDQMHEQRMVISSEDEQVKVANRKDKFLLIPQVNLTMESNAIPQQLSTTYFNILKYIVPIYKDQYNIDVPLQINCFKIHKAEEGEGYHIFHRERSDISTAYRELAFMTYIQSPEEGGETEFLFQKLRIEPIMGRTLIWPAGFTHHHRGGLVIKGQKLYITGWLELVELNPEYHHL